MTFVLSVFIGFSLNNWLSTNNYTRTEPLPLMVSADLLTHLNVQTYLKQPSCQQGGSLYTTTGTRWNNGEYPVCVITSFYLILFYLI